MSIFEKIIQYIDGLPLYIKHILSLTIVFPLIILLTVIISAISLLSVIPIVGRLKSAIQDWLVTNVLIPGSDGVQKNLPNLTTSRQPSPRTDLPSDCSMYLGGNMCTDLYRVNQQTQEIRLPHIPNAGWGMHERVDHYVRYVKAILEKKPYITTLNLHGHSMGGAILAQVVARLSEDDELLKEKTIELTLDRTYNNFAAASSAALGYGVPRFLLYFIYAQLDLNLNTEKAIAQYTAKSKQISTTIIVSNMDEILGDHVLNFHDNSKNISMKLVDIGHNDTLHKMNIIENPDSTIKPCNRSFCYAIDAMIVLTALQFTGILGVGFALLGLGLPAILPLALFMGTMVLLTHRVYHTTVFSFALQDIHTKNNADQIKNMTIIICGNVCYLLRFFQ